MKKILSLSATILILMFTLGEKSFAATIIGSFSERQWDSNLYNGISQDVTFEASYYLWNNIPSGYSGPFVPPPDQWPEWEPMIDLTLNSSLAGNTWMYQSGAPGYAEAVKTITNGSTDVFAFMAANSDGYISERYCWDLVDAYYTGKNGIDFEGFTIDSIAFVLDQFKPVDDPGAFYYTVNIYGEQNTSPVPVPCSLLLLGTGLAGLAGTRLRRKKR